MQKANNPQLNRWQYLAFFLTAVLIVVADQFSKAWIRSNLALGESIPADGFPRLVNMRNTGASFGLFQDHLFALTIISIIGAVIIIVYTLIFHKRLFPSGGLLGIVALGLILGGTVGNLIGRLFIGYVTDFIDFGFWPAFNIADSSAVVGTILFICSLYPLARPGKR